VRGQDLVDQHDGGVPVGGQQLAQRRPHRADGGQLGRVAGVGAGVAVLGVEGVELGPWW
jgi:hypothetical protein